MQNLLPPPAKDFLDRGRLSNLINAVEQNLLEGRILNLDT